MPRIPPARGLAIAALAALSGCGWTGGWFKSAPKEACPAAAVLQPLANTAFFTPGTTEPRPENVTFYGVLSEVDSRCEYSSAGVRVRLDVILVGQRGPAARAAGADFNYFVAVLGPGEQILGKTPFAVHVAFAGDAQRAGVTDHIEEMIPASAGKGSDLSVAVGFQQSPEAIEFYKHFRGR